MDKKAYDRARYLANREAVIARASEWAKANPMKRREIAKRNNGKRAREREEWHQRNVFGGVIERNACSVCGTTDGGPRGLVIHHKDANKANNDPSNLTVLCRACHVRVHRVWGLEAVS